MPDITMCKGTDGVTNCHLRKDCYRFTATPSDNQQAYFVGMPLKKAPLKGSLALDCNYYTRR